MLNISMDQDTDPASMPPMGSEHANLTALTTAELQFITFFLGSETFAFPMAVVREIIRMPDLAKMPLAQQGLAGLANLRGVLLPVLNLSTLLTGTAPQLTETSRVVVVDDGTLIGFVVDRINRVVSVDASKMEKVSAFDTSVDAGFLSGIVKEVDDHAMVMMLDVKCLIDANFTKLSQAIQSRSTSTSGIDHKATRVADKQENDRRLVSFLLANQEYAFPIERVNEIVRVPQEISHVPKAAAHVMGIINLRGQLLPLVNLRNMFNLSPGSLNDQSRVVVIALGDADDNSQDQRTVGILTDQVREVLRVSPDLIDPVPVVFTESGNSAEIHSMCRLQDGKRMVSILSVERMFEHEALREAMEIKSSLHGTGKLGGTQMDGQTARDGIEQEIQLVVFNLHNEEYGVLIESVQEIIRIPNELTHVPKAQHFIEGMVNLRGLLLPVVDLRAKMGMERMERSDRQRIVVFTLEGVRTGFIVDSVSEVLKISTSSIEAAPDFSEEQQQILSKVANLETEKRMILILEAGHLLGSQELETLKKTVA